MQELPKVIQEAMRVRDLDAQVAPNFPCHTRSSYSDGYGDAQYGDYSDGESYSDSGA